MYLVYSNASLQMITIFNFQRLYYSRMGCTLSVLFHNLGRACKHAPNTCELLLAVTSPRKTAQKRTESDLRKGFTVIHGLMNISNDKTKDTY